MRPITVSVGPLAAGSATAITASQTLTQPGQIILASAAPAGGANTFTAQISATIAGAVLTVASVASGQLFPGDRLDGNGVAPNTRIIGLAPGSSGTGAGSTWIVTPSQTVSVAQNFRANHVITLDQPRQVLVTTTEPAGNSITIYGTDAAGTPIQETLATNGGNLTTNQNFKTVTQVTVANTPAGAISVGTSTATSQWVNFDPWAAGNVSYQTDLAGTANYTVQITNDDPTSPTNPVAPGAMSWLPDPNAALVGASTAQFAVWQFVPLWARVLLNSGAGAVTATFVQTQNVNR